MKSPDLKLVLAGFSGAGKTTVLGELSRQRPAFKAIDLDEVVRQGQGSLADLIEKWGWEEFRAREKQALSEILKMPAPWILALGGGSLGQGLSLLQQSDAILIHLDCPFEVCWQRIQDSSVTRPLVTQGKAALSKLFLERKEQFDQVPKKVDASRCPEEVALAILRLVELA
jgi:shikimate kinase